MKEKWSKFAHGTLPILAEAVADDEDGGGARCGLLLVGARRIVGDELPPEALHQLDEVTRDIARGWGDTAALERVPARCYAIVARLREAAVAALRVKPDASVGELVLSAAEVHSTHACAILLLGIVAGACRNRAQRLAREAAVAAAG